MTEQDQNKETERNVEEKAECIFSGEMKQAEDGSFYIDIPFEIFQQIEEAA